MVSNGFVLFLSLSGVLLLLHRGTCDHECQHGVLESAFPPLHFFQFLNDSYMARFDEVMVIGDVHGCLTELKMLIKKANVTEPTKLKILAGDFMKKGPNSLEVLRFIRDTPGILAVRGNNDQKVIDMQYKSQHFGFKLAGDNDFIKKMKPEDVDFVRSLPYTIVIPSLGAVIVHGGVRPKLNMELNEPFDLMNIRNVVASPKCRGGWRPSLKHGKGFQWASQWHGPHHVIFGHDASRALQIYPLATGIDTRCVFGDYLTGYFIKGPRNGTLVHQEALKSHFKKAPADVVFARWLQKNHKSVATESEDELKKEFKMDYAV